MRPWLSWAALGAAWVASCASDESAPPSSPSEAGTATEAPAAAGGAGAPAQATPGGRASGSGGEPSAESSGGAPTPSGGANVSGDASDAGRAGEGGALPVVTQGERCVAISQAGDCGATLTSCAESSQCAPWLACLASCEDARCVGGCDEVYSDARRVLPAVYQCLCAAPECATLGACERTSCAATEQPALMTEAPRTLAETGLYTLEGVYTYAPQFPLWSDGLDKERHVFVPGCATIDTSDMDEWKLPVGTRLWKTFGQGAVALETRLMHRYGPGPADWLYAAYQWDPSAPGDATKATWTEGAVVVDASGSGHDIPGNGNCKQCHDGRKERALGFSAIQLSHESSGADLTLRRLSELGWLTVPAPEGFAVPGDEVQRAALGYVHGNCGGCHDQDGKLPDPESPLILRLRVAQTSYAEADAVRTTVNVPVRSGLAALAGKDRIEPGKPEESGLLVRLRARGIEGLQMPPYNSNSTKLPDSSGGIARVTAWVSGLTP
ncbi:MAG: hypothetical protein EOO73_19805 [Myxococcales bacterium]|nr:MAG: hypothetical protein EOO73_19805 [Myxococcales bacterium]